MAKTNNTNWRKFWPASSHTSSHNNSPSSVQSSSSMKVSISETCQTSQWPLLFARLQFLLPFSPTVLDNHTRPTATKIQRLHHCHLFHKYPMDLLQSYNIYADCDIYGLAIWIPSCADADTDWQLGHIEGYIYIYLQCTSSWLESDGSNALEWY